MFDDNVIWITGASSGIGEALANELAPHNPKLILSARRESELERVQKNIPEEFQDRIKIFPLDLEDADSLEDKVTAAENLFGQIDILINNAGISQRDTVLNTSMEVNRKLMEVNYFGCIALSKFLLPGMIARKSGHHVIISSATGYVSTPGRSAYAATKHALHGFYDALRAEHHPDNIKVTMVCPGYIRTNLSYNALKGDGSPQDKMDKTHENAMTPETCAKKIVKAISKQKDEVYNRRQKRSWRYLLKEVFSQPCSPPCSPR